MINNNEGSEKTIIISGVNGDIGQEFTKALVSRGELYGISRTPKKTDLEYTHICADLLSPGEFSQAFKQINPSKDILYVHLPGKFRFEDANHPIMDRNDDGIDDHIYETNVLTFRNVRDTLLDYLESNSKSRIKLVGIGSASDIYNIPFWQSFTRSKNELRREFRLMYGYPKTYGRVSSLIVNVSTVSGTQLSEERPFIDREFCLSPNEVVSQSLPYVLDDQHSFLEVSVIKPNPAFTDPNYLSCDRIRERWYKDMYGDSKIEEVKGGNL